MIIIYLRRLNSRDRKTTKEDLDMSLVTFRLLLISYVI